MKANTIAHLLHNLAQRVGVRALSSAQARQLMLRVLQRPADQGAWLLAHSDAELSPEALVHWLTAVEQLANGVPLAYVLGTQEFYGLCLRVSPDVLIPRPDSEVLIDWALALDCPPDATVLDLGTGSGALALALKQQRRDWQIHAADASDAALAIARHNAHSQALDLHFWHGDWFSAVPAPQAQRYHLIISNPPYIAANDAHLPALRHEPRQALVSGHDGLDAIGHISQRARDYLLPGGSLLFEHGYNQAQCVARILRQQGFKQIEQRRDLAGHLRCSGGLWGG